MIATFNTNSRAGMITAKIEAYCPITIRLIAYNPENKNVYLKHKVKIVKREGNKYIQDIYLKLPISPDKLVVILFVKEEGIKKGNNSKYFRIISFKDSELPTCPIFMNPEDISYVKFAIQFAKRAKTLSAGDKIPHIYRSDDGKFNIDYYKKIRDKKSGSFVSTPARVNHGTQIIQCSKNDLEKYSVSQIVVILLHERSHITNPRIGREISDEVSADVNALMIYYSLGFSELEALTIFLNVFRLANTEQNHLRTKIILDFTRRFMNGEVCQVKSNGVVVKQAA